jgi:hypothetical protein
VITQTEGGGFLTVWGGDASDTLDVPSTSNVNWTTSGQTLANLASPPSARRTRSRSCAAARDSTHVIVDVQGYVPFVT